MGWTRGRHEREYHGQVPSKLFNLYLCLFETLLGGGFPSNCTEEDERRLVR